MHFKHPGSLLWSMWTFIFLSCVLFAGCSRNTTPSKTDSVDFTVVSGTDIPEELKTLINERKQNAFELTYSDGAYLYIIKGYGKQASGGYSIVVNNFYQSEDSLVFETELIGPKKDTQVSSACSYPYIVIKTQYRENPVVFP